MATHHILVSGKVQGVFYRANAKKMAQSSKLVGWIRNTVDGEVEIMVTGDEVRLQAFEDWCKTGPTEAEVQGITVTPVAEVGFDDFKIVR